MEQHELILIGGGSGEPQHLLPAAKEALESADFVFSSKRFFALVPAEKLVEADRISQWLEQIPVLSCCPVTRCCIAFAVLLSRNIRNGVHASFPALVLFKCWGAHLD